jgi:hypothetical protein
MIGPATEFGSCCKDLKDSLTIPKQEFFWVSEEGVLYLMIGGVQTERHGLDGSRCLVLPILRIESSGTR